MFDSPSSLQSVCVNYIGSNIEAFYGVVCRELQLLYIQPK